MYPFGKTMKSLLQQQQKTKILFTVCPKCSNILSLDAIENEPESIRLFCPSCSYSDVTLMTNFLDYLKQNQNPKCENLSNHLRQEVPAVEFCPQCSKWLCVQCLLMHNKLSKTHKTFKGKICVESHCSHHKEKLYEFFCHQCKVHFCSLCIDNHEHHNYCELSETVNKDYMKIYNEKFTKAKELFKDNEKIKDIAIDRLTEEIKRMEASYLFNKEVNNNIIQLVDILITNFNKGTPNYYIYQNILHFSNFNIELHTKIEEKDIKATCIDKIFDYYDNNFILKGLKKTRTSLNEKNRETKINTLPLIKEMNFHNSKPVYCLLLLINGRLASCSPDRSIKIFNLSTYQCVLTIPHAHTTSVTYITQLKDGKLVSTSADGTVKLWEISKSSFKCFSTIKCHSDYINKVITLTKERFATCSKDGLIKIWSNKSLKCLNEIDVHTKNVTSILQLKNGCLISGSEDKIINCQSPLLQTIKEFTNIECADSNSIIELGNDYFAIGGENIIYLIGTDLSKILKFTLDDIGLIYSFTNLSKDKILMGTSKGDFYQFDLLSNEIICKKKNAHNGCIYTISSLGDKLFASGAYDGSIKVWNNIN